MFSAQLLVTHILVFLFTLLLFVVSPARAAILLNEISPSTDPEWVELYNDGTDTIDLTGYLLEDGNTSHTDDLILSGTLAAYSYALFTHQEGWLNNGGDTLKLYDNATPSATILDQYTYGSVSAEKSIFRSPNGSENWVIGSPTQNTSNPTPTPSLSPSPSPSLSPSPTPIPPSPTPQPKADPPRADTPKPSPKPSLLPSPALNPDDPGTIAGETIDINLTSFGASPTPSPAPTPIKPSLNRARAKTALATGTGLILLSLAIFLAIRRFQKSNRPNV